MGLPSMQMFVTDIQRHRHWRTKMDKGNQQMDMESLVDKMENEMQIHLRLYQDNIMGKKCLITPNDNTA